MEMKINRFTTKHGVGYVGQKDDVTYEFSDGMFLDKKDIETDLSLDLPIGAIELYYRESRDG